MDQICNSMLNMVQAPAERPAAKNNTQAQEKDSFQKLMSQKQTGKDSAAGAGTEGAVQENPQDAEAPAVENIQDLEKQMVLAAMAVMQNPVAPMETVMPEETSDLLECAVELMPVGGENVEEMTSRETVGGELTEILENEETVTKPDGEGAVEDIPAAEHEAENTAVDVSHGERETAGRVFDRPADRTEQDSKSKDTAEESTGEVEAPVFKDVRDIPVKVGEAPAAEETQEVPVASQMAEKLTEALKSGDTRVEIQLAPESLGKVTVELTLREDGTLHVALHAENSSTRGLLERSADNLMAMLSREARQEVQVEVPRQQESQQQNFYDGRQGNGQHSRQQQEHRQERRNSEDFLHQLRLGLIPEEGETV